MRILHVNKYGYRRGGSEVYMLELAALQRRAGATVEVFSMRHPQNEPSALDPHLPALVELNPPPARWVERTAAAGRVIWNRRAAAAMDAALEDFQPDVAHLHLIYHQLSPSILRPLARRRIPTVMTLHDFKLACPTYLFLRDGAPCEECAGGRFHRAVLRKCHNGSAAQSAVVAAEAALHSWLRAYDWIRVLVCPSRFMETKMRQAGVFADRLRHVPHFVGDAPVRRAHSHGPILYAGRLAAEKAIDTLVRAVARLPEDERLEVAGEGPERAALEALAGRSAPGRVRFLGHLSPQALGERLASASVLVMPSRCYENQPMIVLEAMAAGLPVVGSDLGGIAELIDDGVDGLLVPPGDPEALAGALAKLVADPAGRHRMGEAGRSKVQAEFSPSRHLERLDAVYREAADATRKPAQAASS